MEVWNAILSEIHKLLLAVLFIYFIVNPLMDYFRIGFDDSDSHELKERSGFKIHTDYKYGWQYLETENGELIPRLDKDGKHVNIKDKK